MISGPREWPPPNAPNSAERKSFSACAAGASASAQSATAPPSTACLIDLLDMGALRDAFRQYRDDIKRFIA